MYIPVFSFQFLSHGTNIVSDLNDSSSPPFLVSFQLTFHVEINILKYKNKYSVKRKPEDFLYIQIKRTGKSYRYSSAMWQPHEATVSTISATLPLSIMNALGTLAWLTQLQGLSYLERIAVVVAVVLGFSCVCTSSWPSIASSVHMVISISSLVVLLSHCLTSSIISW